jgi:hypothetical protein
MHHAPSMFALGSSAIVTGEWIYINPERLALTRAEQPSFPKVEEQIGGCFPDRGLGNLSTISVTGNIRSTSKASLVNYCICSILKRRVVNVKLVFIIEDIASSNYLR